MGRKDIAAVLGLAALSLAGSAVPGPGEERDDPWTSLELEIAARGLEPDKVPVPARLTQEMKEWVHSQVPSGTPPEVAFRSVLGALVEPKGLGLEYDPSFTGTAEEVWASRKANCLGFTHLFVGLTRELGIHTYYVRWEQIERFRREGDLVLVSGHVSAGWGIGPERQVLEFGAVDGLEPGSSRRISDLNATARHFANRSAEWLRLGNAEKALEAAELATTLDPTLADGWVNLGVSRRRSNDLEGAEAAYRQATVVAPDHLPAYQNLSVLLQMQGAEDSARTLLELLDRRDNRNPFTYLALGDMSFEAGRYDEAARYYRRAVRLGRGLAEPRAAMGLVCFQQRELRKARKWLQRARRIDAEEGRVRELAELLSPAELTDG